jgi:two-component system sensor histidine kinase CreC
MLLLALGGWFVITRAIDEVKPVVRQSTEETLVDTANLLAEIVAKDVARGTLNQAQWHEVLQQYGLRRPNAQIWEVKKSDVNYQVYIVNRFGRVLLDSTGRDVGKDYSNWRDVYLTLRGQYGARSTRAVPDDDSSTVMYVAAPIYEGKQVVGAVTVSKPNRTLQPFVMAATQRLLGLGVGFVAGGVVLGGLISLWLSRAVGRLTEYARRVSGGERARVPQLPGSELTQLASALESMRAELDGQAYVERYVQTLTHELKSPLAGIRAASELLRGEIPADKRLRFLNNVDAEAQRLQAMCERLLLLAQVETRRSLHDRQSIPLAAVWTELLERNAAVREARQVTVRCAIAPELVFEGERFLAVQAFSNLLENAVDFTPEGGCIEVTGNTQDGMLNVDIYNPGAEIPDYALPRVTERFYSLPRPDSGRKSTGLGLNFVQEVAHLHGGQFSIQNCRGGVLARLTLAVSPTFYT